MHLLNILVRWVLIKSVILINKAHYLVKKPKFLNNSKLNILIINNQGYGDAIVMTPTLRQLKNNLDCCIIVVASQRSYETLKKCSYVDKFLLYEGNFFKYFNLIKEIRKMSVDICFDTQITITNLRRWILPFLTNSKYKVSFKRGGFRGFWPDLEIEYSSHHMVENYLDLVKPFVKDIKTKSPEVYFSKDDAKWAENIMHSNKTRKKVIVIHTYSENSNHLWKDNEWIGVVKELSKNNKIIFIAPKEGLEYVNNIVNKINNKVDVVVPDSFNKLAALISKVDLLITIDTSTVHISSATKTPAVAIYGPTILNYWGPLNNNQIALQKSVVCNGKCRECDFNHIFASQERCQDYGDNCINHITADEVIQAAKTLLT